MPSAAKRRGAEGPRPRAGESASQTAYDGLKAILQPYAKRLTVDFDRPGGYSLSGPVHPKFKKPMFFGAVQVRKKYVSFYLMPVYMFPDLLRDVSPGLRKRMQGKSCFNFAAVDAKLYRELTALARKGYQRFRQEGFAT